MHASIQWITVQQNASGRETRGIPSLLKKIKTVTYVSALCAFVRNLVWCSCGLMLLVILINLEFESAVSHCTAQGCFQDEMPRGGVHVTMIRTVHHEFYSFFECIFKFYHNMSLFQSPQRC